MIKNDSTQNKFILVDNNSLSELTKLNKKSLKSIILNDKIILKPNEHFSFDLLLSFIDNKILNIKFSKDEILQLNNNEFINSLKNNYDLQPFLIKFELAKIIDSIKYLSPHKFIKFVSAYSHDFIDFVAHYDYEIYNYFCNDKEVIHNYESMNYEKVIKSRIEEINSLHEADSFKFNNCKFDVSGTYFYSGEIIFLNELNKIHNNYMLSLCS